jgi:hypothetical protein
VDRKEQHLLDDACAVCGSCSIKTLVNDSGGEVAVAPPDWAVEFCRLANKAKPDTFELANAAYRARKALPRGEWSKLWRCGAVPFAKRTGEALVLIGLRFGIPNAQTSARLPTEWTILHQLARLPFSPIETLIAQKVIQPRLTYKQARDLVVTILGTRRPRSAQTRIQQQFGRLLDSVHEAGEQLNWADRAGLATQLRELASELTPCSVSAAAGELGRAIHFPVNDVAVNGSEHAPAL